MRVSVNSDADRAFMAQLEDRGWHFEFWLDGIKQDELIEADEAAGVVVKHARKQNGDYIMDGGSIALKRHTGKVRIEIVRK